MSLKEAIARLSADYGDLEEFGIHGPTAPGEIANRIEAELNVTLPPNVRLFIEEYGCIQFGVNEFLNFVPNSTPGCIELTKTLRTRYPHVSPHFIVIHREEVVWSLLDTQTERIYQWESYHSPPPTTYLTELDNLEAFLEFLAKEARMLSEDD